MSWPLRQWIGSSARPLARRTVAFVCGRYVSSRPYGVLAEEFGVESVRTAPLPPDWNVAPTKDVYAVLTRRHDDRPVRQLRTLRWGLVPPWADDAKISSRLVNARIETAAIKPAFRRAFAARRCLLPADGYYEWYAGEGARKQPFFITPRDGGGLAMAGLYELWRPDPDAEWLWTCTVLTTEAVDEVGQLHERMPLLVPPASWQRWLDPELSDPTRLTALLRPALAGPLAAYPVSTAVGNVANNGPELVEPVPPAEEPTLF